MVQNVLNGFHSTIFCYGQTGSGKSYTMDGLKYRRNEKGVFVPQVTQEETNNAKILEHDGLVQRCVKTLVSRIDSIKKNRRVSLNVSFMQIYNEKIYDLLNPGMFKRFKGDGLVQPSFHSQGASGLIDPAGLKLKWNPFDVYTVENLFTFQCHSAQEILKLFYYGLKNKVIGSHKMNLTSSRSHTIFSMVLE